MLFPNWQQTSVVVPLLARVVVVATILMVPVRAVQEGFLPTDDALSHAAKVVSGKDWGEILLRRPEIALDGHPGWHALLGAGRALTGADATGVLLLAIGLGFAAFWLPPALGLRRPEAWLAAGTVLMVSDAGIVGRHLLGRPFLTTAAYGVVSCLLADRLTAARLPWAALGAVASAAALSTWAHSGWYQLAIPLLAFALAGDGRRAVRVAAATGAGILLGACLTGHPVAFLVQAIVHLRLVLGGETLPRQALAGELQPALVVPAFVLACVAFLLWRTQRGEGTSLRHPALVLALTGLTLGPLGMRFWTDWGVSGALVWITLEIQQALERRMDAASLARGATTALFCTAFLLHASADTAGRWTTAPRPTFPRAADPEAGPLLPEPGGVFYTAEMRLYFRAFFHNPDARWVYVLGFEPAIMRREDLAVYRAWATRPGDLGVYAPWVSRMGQRDRLVLTHRGADPPEIPQLEWHRLAPDVWSGRKPRPGAP